MRPLIVSPRGHGHRPKTVTELLINLIEKRRRLDFKEGCWIDTGTLASAKGYTKLFYSRAWILVTHFIWEILHGPVPKGMLLCHHCDTPACFNPAHLFLGTNADNQRDMIAKGRQRHPRGDEVVNRKIGSEQVRLIRDDYASGGISFSKLGSKYGISKTHARSIVRGFKWKCVQQSS